MRSTPDVALVIGNPMTFEEPEVLLLERSRPMMLVLAPHILPDLIDPGLADGECPIPRLPLESSGQPPRFVDPFRRVRLDQPDHLGDGAVRPKSRYNVKMIGHAADLEENAALGLDDPRDVLLQLIPKRWLDHRLPILGAEDDVVEEVRVGTGHRDGPAWCGDSRGYRPANRDAAPTELISHKQSLGHIDPERSRGSRLPGAHDFPGLATRATKMSPRWGWRFVHTRRSRVSRPGLYEVGPP